MFGSPNFDGHEFVSAHCDIVTGLDTVIACHESRAGPVIAGCRVVNHLGDDRARDAVLRLSRLATIQAAITEMPFGGGQIFVKRRAPDDNRQDPPGLDRWPALGRLVDRYGGTVVAAPDHGSGEREMAEIRRATPHVVGLPKALGGHGDPAPDTAYGVLATIHAVVERRLGRSGVAGLSVAINGLGPVGLQIARLLAAAGAVLTVADRDPAVAKHTAETLDAKAVPVTEIHTAAVDLYCPCEDAVALDGNTLRALQAGIVVGAAERPLAGDHLVELAHQRGVLAAPAVVSTAGRLMCFAGEQRGHNPERIASQVERLYDIMHVVLSRALDTGVTLDRAAEDIAVRRLGRPAASALAA